MLGPRIADPHGIEGPPGDVAGLGLLDVETDPGRREDAGRSRAASSLRPAQPVRGYEMHVGRTARPRAAPRPMLRLGDARRRRRLSADGRVLGCYLHGLFAADGFRRAFLARLAAATAPAISPTKRRSRRTLDALADHLEAHLDLDALFAVAAVQTS